MSARVVSAESADNFRQWLATGTTPLGLYLSEAGRFTVADRRDAWSTVDAASVQFVTDEVARMSRAVYASRPSQIVSDLARRYGTEISRLAAVRDVLTVFALCRPGTPAPRVTSARAVVRLWGELIETADASTRRNVGLSLRVESAFRYRQHEGWQVDVPGIRDAITENETQIRQAAVVDGIDLSDQSGERAQARVHAWLGTHGIRIRDRDGNPSLSRAHFGTAEADGTPSADYAWARFRAAVTRLSARQALGQLVGNLDADGRVRAAITVRGARTGRGTITSPNLSALSRTFRHLVLSAQPGHVLVSLDLDRVEPSCMAYLSGDTEMMDALTHGDIYEQAAVAAYGDTAHGNPELRRIGKKAVLAPAYGQGDASLALDLGISVDEARRVREAIFSRFTRFADWAADARTRARHGEQLHNATGRILPRLEPGEAYKQVNHLVQSYAADLFYAGIDRVVQALPSIGLDERALYLPVHDELILSVPVASRFEAAALLEEQMLTDLGPVVIGGTAKLLGGRWRTA